ncbi:MAG: VOC family protein [Anaerolineaceae bacterium]|nr:VOC family protein [Anaerolineaceae bacterium]
MSETDEKQPKAGQILWRDLTVPDAPAIRDFYKAVIGWEHSDHPMGEYNDYNMLQAETGEVITGVVNKRGVNAAIPSVWLMYVGVEDVDDSLRQCEELGGRVLVPPSTEVAYRYAVIEDPAGAILGIMQLAGPQEGSEENSDHRQ